jgi:hypothetical protein
MKYVALFLLLCLFGCASTPAPKDTDVNVIGHRCERGAVVAMRFVEHGEAAIGELLWDNKQVCGDQT